MTNTQKAQEIAKVHEVHYDRVHGETSNDECFLSALEMAECKDEQHAEEKRQWIEKACELLKDSIHDYYVINQFEEWFDAMFEDFGEVMKGE